MYELVQTGVQSYYINSPAKIGVYIQSANDVYLIDSGNDKEAAKKVLKIAQQQNWHIKGILNTHSNADHIGGNAYLQEKTGCLVFAGGIEAAMTQYPLLEPSFLFGGYPCKNLRNKFLMAKSSEVTDFSSSKFPSEIDIIQLPGHFFDMVGFRLPDGTVFLADCVSSPQTLEKYGVTFIYDVAKYLETLEMVERMEAKIFVPSHTQPCHDMKALVKINRDKVYEIEQIIISICSIPQTIDEIIHSVFIKLNLGMTIEQYVLVGSTIKSYLSWMNDRGILGYSTDDYILKWYSL